MVISKKLLGAAALSFALAGGGAAGALLGTPITSAAQESPSDAGDEVRAAGHVHRGGRFGAKLTSAATALGMSEADLRAALRAGKTIAEVAEERGVEVDTVIDALVAEATAKLRERITAMVNGELPDGDKAGHHRGHRARRRAR